MVKKMLKALEDEGVVQNRPDGIKVIRDVMWYERRNRSCYG